MPVYNEVATVVEVLDKLGKLDLEGLTKQVIVVDDGSTDGTAEVLSDVKDVTVVTHDSNRGKGAALRTGFAKVKGDLIVIQDADLEYDPKDIPLLLEPLVAGDADVVYGSRFTGYPRRALLFWNDLGNRFLTLLTNVLGNINITDMETCYKAFTKRVLDENEYKSDGFDFEPEFTMKAAKRGYRIYEVPVSYHGRTVKEGKKITLWDGVHAVGALLKYRVVDR